MFKNMMKKLPAMLALLLAVVLIIGTVPASAADEQFVNPGFEDGTMTGFSTQGNNIKAEVTSGDTHSGEYALKVTGRKTADEMPFQSLAGDAVVMDQWYEFSVWVKPSRTVWCALIVTPWAVGNETGAMMWNDSYGDQKVCEEGVWTKLSCQYKLYVKDNKLYVENGFDWVVAKNHAGTGDTTLNFLQQVDFKVNAEPGAEILMVDDFSLTLVNDTEDPTDPTDTEPTEPTDTEPTEPTDTEPTEPSTEPSEEPKPTEPEKTEPQPTETKPQSGKEPSDSQDDGGSSLWLYIGIGAAVVVIAVIVTVVLRRRKK